MSLLKDSFDERLEKIEHSFMADGVGFSGSIELGVDDVIRDAVETRYAKYTPRPKMVFLLTTPGGYIEVVQRIVATIRKHYALVDFVIPNYAYSAGTVLRLCCQRYSSA